MRPSGAPTSSDGDRRTVPWRALLAETAERLSTVGLTTAGQEAHWLVEEVSGLDGADWVMGLDEPATQRGVARLDALVERRCGGEPIQYVLARWSFRSLDLMCDRRALIPRPETEQVVEVALVELDRLRSSRPAGVPTTVIDLGTGSGAIALAVAAERPGTDVWATERSWDALSVARANLAGLGMAGTRVRIVQGSWFEGVPPGLRGAVDLVVSNPPYVAADEDLPPSVADWEPVEALVAGPRGLEAHEQILAEALAWLAPGGAIVLEVGATQATAVMELARAANLVDGRASKDLAGHDRIVVARRSAS